MSNKTTHVIINPASAGGKTGKRATQILPVIDRYFGKEYSLFTTQMPLEACLSAASAVRKGAELVIAVGGDGTVQEVVNGLFLNGHLINPECHFGVVSSGTGKGFAQSIGLPESLQEQVELIHEGHTELIDIARVDYANDEEEQSHRYFLNECQIGIGGEVVQTVQRNHKRLGGTVAFGLGTLETTFRYRNQYATVKIDNISSVSGYFTGVLVANGAYTGGGMNLAPRARVNDGQLNVLLMRDLTVVQRLRVFPKIYSGSHIYSPLFSYLPASSVTIDSPEKVLVEADGELLGTTPCNVKILAAQLRVRI